MSKQEQSTSVNGLTASFTGNTTNTSSAGNHKHNVRVRNDGFPNDWEDYTTDYKSEYWHTSYNQSSQRYNLNPETEHAGNHSHTITPSGTVSLSGDAETRPSNYTVKIWKRTA